MAQILATATKTMNVPPERVLAFLRDYSQARPSILPDNYSRYRVEEGGQGAGTVFSYHFKSGPTERDFRMRAEEADGRLIERDELSTFVTSWTVAEAATGSAVTVEIHVGGGWRHRRVLRAVVRAARAATHLWRAARATGGFCAVSGIRLRLTR